MPGAERRPGSSRQSPTSCPTAGAGSRRGRRSSGSAGRGCCVSCGQGSGSGAANRVHRPSSIEPTWSEWVVRMSDRAPRWRTWRGSCDPAPTSSSRSGRPEACASLRLRKATAMCADIRPWRVGPRSIRPEPVTSSWRATWRPRWPPCRRSGRPSRWLRCQARGPPHATRMWHSGSPPPRRAWSWNAPACSASRAAPRWPPG